MLFRGFLVLTILLHLITVKNTWGNRSNETIAFSRCAITQKLDSLKKIEIFSNPMQRAKHELETFPTFPDLVYEIKIAQIDYLSPISFDYNEHVREYIDIYTLERRGQVSQMLGLAELYFPLFDEMLDKYQLPLEFKYLAVVESALNPLAVSTSGAVGLWQFKINSGRMFDLEVNSYIDERMDPIKSTEAACLYLKYLYSIFKDWHLVMAAYNAGPGVVRNAIFRSGGETNFWKLREHLTIDAQKYVPAFIAAAYVMRNAKNHGIEPSTPIISYSQTDTVKVSMPVSFSVISENTGVPIDVIRFLNPTYRRGYVPVLDNWAVVRLPEKSIEQFLRNEKKIYETTPNKKTFHDVLANAGDTFNRIMLTHTVEPGDYLHKIAVKYSCTIDDIKVWNLGVDSNINIGQKIVLWVDEQVFRSLQQSRALP